MQFSLSVLQQLVVTSMCRGLVVCLCVCVATDAEMTVMLWRRSLSSCPRCTALWLVQASAVTNDFSALSESVDFFLTYMHKRIYRVPKIMKRTWCAGTGWQWKQTGRYGISAAFKVDSSSLEWMCAGWEFHVGVNNCLECVKTARNKKVLSHLYRNY